MAPPEDESKHTRRLSAVLLADLKGYSRLMGESEADALAGVDAVREVFAKVVPEHGGSLEVSVGDCFVALFPSAVGAVQAAVDIQAQLADPSDPRRAVLRVRIGVHLGEVVRTESGFFGDSINIAARVQEFATPGGVNVSEEVYRAVRNRLALPFEDTGPHALKNIRDPVRVYRVGKSGGTPTPRAKAVPAPAVAGARTAVARPRWQVASLLALVPLVLLAVLLVSPRRTPQPQHERPSIAKAEGPLVVGVMEIRARGAVPDWMRDFTRDGLNTVLSEVAALRVYSKQKIDFVREKRGLSEIEAAEALGISKMISGTIASADSGVALEVQVVDIASGLLEDSERVQGREEQLVELQNRVVINVMRALSVTLAADDVKKILAKRTNDTLDSYKLLTETLEGAGEEGGERKPEAHGGRSWLFPWPAAAYAEEVNPEEAAVRKLLERYRAALEAKDLDQLATIQAPLSEGQRGALRRYFENAESLKVQFTNLDILFEGDEALATFTRSDVFKDARSGREMHLDVRMSSVLAKQEGGWKIRALKKPS